MQCLNLQEDKPYYANVTGIKNRERPLTLKYK